MSHATEKKGCVVPFPGGGVAIYHAVLASEGFEEAASAIIGLVREAQQVHPFAKRHLFLDIDEHRNSQGGLDEPMFRLVHDFLIGRMMTYLDTATTPLVKLKNPRQIHRVPEPLP